MSNPVYKKVRIAWKYPTQPTSLQVGTVRIVRSTQPFTVEDALNQTQIDYREYSPEFTFYDDGYELEEGLTYYYMIICYGDIDDTIIAATGLYSIKIEAPTQTPTIDDGDGEIPPDEMHFTTIAGTIDYYGVVGDQLVFSDGTTVTMDKGYLFNIAAPAGKHKVVLKEPRRESYVGLSGEALIELHNFPTLSSVDTFNTYPNNPSPNLVKVPTVLPPNITNISKMFIYANSFNQDISSWDVSNVTYMDHLFYAASAFNQDLSQWCVSNITDPPLYFDEDATNWTLPRPVWGTCPNG